MRTNSGPRAHLLDVAAAGISHGGAQAAGELLQDRDQAALVGHAALDALRHQLLELRGGVLEIAVGRAVALAPSRRASPCRDRTCRRRPGRARPRPGIPRCRRTCRRSSRVRAGGDRLGDIARVANAAVGDHRHVRCPASASATFATALICGTPTPAMMRVVQIDPGPMPTFTASAPCLTRSSAASAVTMLPPMTCRSG